jgi:hypothetical protein
MTKEYSRTVQVIDRSLLPSVIWLAEEIRMNVRKVFIAAALAVGGVAMGVAIAQGPAENVNPGRHPNLAAAQRLTNQAFEKIVAAQQANEWDLQGHAAKAKELLDQANNELKQAAQAANRNHK